MKIKKFEKCISIHCQILVFAEDKKGAERLYQIANLMTRKSSVIFEEAEFIDESDWKEIK